MYGESRTAPGRPPPGPEMPGIGVFGPLGLPQHALASPDTSASSNVIASNPSFWYAGDDMMRGTQTFSKSLMDCRPPGLPSAQPVSCPSLHRSGVIQVKFAVVLALLRSALSRVSGPTLRSHAPESSSEWK